MQQFNRYLGAMRDSNVDDILDAMGEKPQSIIRDYVNDTGL